MGARCPRCGATFAPGLQRCLHDGEALVPDGSTDLSGGDLGRYQLIDVLGRGGLATVYRARHVFDGHECALKVLKQAVAGDAIYLERFRREAAAIKRIEHPNVVKVLDFGVTDDATPYLAMEALHGRTLAMEIGRIGRLDSTHAASIARQVARGLGAVHVEGFIHRDLKPGNIMLVQGDDGDVVKILDFGLVREQPGVGEGETRLTAAGKVAGTPRYMAPEQILGDDMGPWTDLYALGVIIYEMLAGVPMFDGSVDALLRAHLDDAPPPAPMALGLEVVGEALVAKEPERRPQDADAVVAMIDALGEQPTMLAHPEQGAALQAALRESRPPPEAAHEAPPPRGPSEWGGFEGVSVEAPVAPQKEHQIWRYLLGFLLLLPLFAVGGYYAAGVTRTKVVVVEPSPRLDDLPVADVISDSPSSAGGTSTAEGAAKAQPAEAPPSPGPEVAPAAEVPPAAEAPAEAPPAEAPPAAAPPAEAPRAERPSPAAAAPEEPPPPKPSATIKPRPKPRSTDWFHKGDALRAAGEPLRALSAYENAAKKPRDAARAHAGMGGCYLDMNKPVAALNQYRRALLSKPNFAAAHFGKAKALLASGDPEGAQPALQSYLDLAPSGRHAAEARRLLGR